MKRLLIILFLALPILTMADHLVGGDIQYLYIGDSTGVQNHYEVTLRLYRDVGGIQLGIGPQYVNVCSSCFGNLTVTMTLYEGGPGHYSPTLFDCVDEGIAGTVQMEYYIYKGEIVLPGVCNDFSFTYESCCRNSAINNLVNPVQSGFLLKAKLNNSFRNNSSPNFLSEPVRAFCVDNDFYWQHYAKDVDGDSIYYALSPVKAYTGVCNEQELTYEAGYSYVQPVSTAPGHAMKLDHATGMMHFLPSQIETAVLALEVREYAYDSAQTSWYPIGTSYRDIQITISPFCKDLVRAGVYLDSNTVTYIPNLNSPKIKALCGDSVIKLNFAVKANCNSITKSGSEFTLESAQGNTIPINYVNFNCDVNNETDEVLIYLKKPMSQNSLYKLRCRIGTDGNTLVNKCGFSTPQTILAFVEVNDCVPLNFVLTNVSVIKDQRVKLDWDINLSSVEPYDFKSYKVYRRKRGGSWVFLKSIIDINARSFIDYSLSLQNLDAWIYEYKIEARTVYGIEATTAPRNTICLKSNEVDCDSLNLSWNGYKTRYGGFKVQVGSIETGYLVWHDIPGSFLPDITTLDSNMVVRLPKSDVGGYKLRVISPAFNQNYFAHSNWIDCICKEEIPVEKVNVIVPNVFTPNGDGLNDGLTISGLESYSNSELIIFNRWGNVVYRNEDYSNDTPWNGFDMNGNKLTNGVYMYSLRLSQENIKEPLYKNGSVTLMY